jgi:ABC-type proline/glycine betaine transport system substrate-binding protein
MGKHGKTYVFVGWKPMFFLCGWVKLVKLMKPVKPNIKQHNIDVTTVKQGRFRLNFKAV